jgi:hypothetical protein
LSSGDILWLVDPRTEHRSVSIQRYR